MSERERERAITKKWENMKSRKTKEVQNKTSIVTDEIGTLMDKKIKHYEGR